MCMQQRTNPLYMPCCSVARSVIKFCGDCIKILCEDDPGTPETVGKCPLCDHRRFEYETDGGSTVTGLKVYEKRGRCRMCCQPNKVLIEDTLCENCLVGRDHEYSYTCARCGGSQTISHAMWKYQSAPDKFGSAAWACCVWCGRAFTHWKIAPEDVDKIPAALVPASWRPPLTEAEIDTKLARVRTLAMSKK